MSAGLLDTIRSSVARLLALGQTRFALFGVELREELARLASALIGGLAVLVLLALGVSFGALALILYLPPEQRVSAAILVAAAFLGLAALVAWIVVRLARVKPRPFDATLKELERDYEAIKP
ncbi:MAG TPA: phage holin family protein [Burkholderiales bacterium]|nr:phage holin family protein [Burkholderiales bacterium]